MHTENLNFAPLNNLDSFGANWQQTNSLTATDLPQPFQGNFPSGSFSTPALEEPVAVDETEMEFQWHFPKYGFTYTFQSTHASDTAEANHTDPLTGDVLIDSEAVLGAALFQAKKQLKTFANDEEFLGKLNQAFEFDVTSGEAKALIEDLASGETMPAIDIVAVGELNNANAVFGEGTIYISEEFLSENINCPEVLESVLLEEIGHAVDKELGNSDSSGDEGNIFAQLVRDETITSDSLASVALELSVFRVQERLGTFVAEDDFFDEMKQAFGDDLSSDRASAIVQDLANGKAIPEIKIVSADRLNNANGAFGQDTIYLAEEFLTENVANPEAVESVLLEEIGHYLDKELGSGDSKGDEGALFAKLVQDDTISEAELDELQTEGDRVTIGLNGEETTVELATPPYPGYAFEYEGQANVPYDSNVELWQQQMQNLGYDLTVDGLYGPESESIAIQFQQDQGLAVDGIVGPNTWEASFATDSTPPPQKDADTAIDRVINEARSWLGTTEEPIGSNFVPGITDWLDVPSSWGDSYEWCVAAVSRWLSDGGERDLYEVQPSISNGASWTDGVANHFKGLGRFDINPQRGDLVLYDRSDDPYTDHLALVTAVNPDGTFNTIDGNVQDKVVERTNISVEDGVVGFAHLTYGDDIA